MKTTYTFKAQVVVTNRAILRAYAYALGLERKLDFDTLQDFDCSDQSMFRAPLLRMPKALLVIDEFCGGGVFGDKEREACIAVAEAMPKECDNQLPEHASKGWPCVALGYLVKAIDKGPDREATKFEFAWAMCGVMDSVQNGPRPELAEELTAMIEADTARAPNTAIVNYQKRGGWFSKSEPIPEEHIRSQDFGLLW